MKVKNENDYFETSDLGLTAALLCVGAKLEAVDKNNPRVSFYFNRELGLEQTVQAFWSHALTVDPLAYFHALKEAKSRIYGPAVR